MGLLDNLRLNQSRGVAASRLAETGRIFIERDGNNFECLAVAFVIAEDPVRRWLRREPADFFTAKHHVGALAALAGVDLSRQPLAPPSGALQYGWQEGHSAGAGEMAHGWLARCGLLSLGMLRSLGIEGKVYAGVFAILPEKLPAGSGRRRHRDVSPFPPVLRDLALVVDAAAPAEQARRAVASVARAAVGKAFDLEEVGVFDVYTGPNLPPGRKGLTFSLVFRSPERTLTDDEVNAAFQRIQEEIVRTAAYQIRK
jgi:phenylalanyl-tRNA synthetase beta chain